MIDKDAYHRQLERAKSFTVTEQHLALLRKANVRWSEVEFGAPEIDGKRPYGNSSVIRDVAEILGTPEPNWNDDDSAVDAWYEANGDRLTRIHVETAIALQIALQTGEFRTGVYVGNGYGAWKPAVSS